MTPTFHFEILQDFVTTFGEQTIILLEKWRSYCKEHPDKKDDGWSEEFDAFPAITACALDIICLTAMGRSVDAQKSMDTPYIKAVYDGSDVIWRRMLSPYYWPDFIYGLTPEGRKSERVMEILHRFTNVRWKEMVVVV